MQILRYFLLVYLVGSLFSLQSGFYDRSYGDEYKNTTNELLDRLAQASSNQEAENIRRKIWVQWIYDIPNNFKPKLEIALDKFYNRNLKSAEEVFSELLQERPLYMEGWNKRATIRFMRGNLNGSLSDIDEVLALEPRHFGALSGLAMISVNQKKYNQALSTYRKLKKIDPNNSDANRFIPMLESLILGSKT